MRLGHEIHAATGGGPTSALPSQLTFGDALRAAGWGVATSFFAVMLAVFVDLEIGVADPPVYASVIAAVVTSVLLLAQLRNKQLGGRSGAVASLATLGWLPMISLALAGQRRPVVSVHLLSAMSPFPARQAEALLTGLFVVLPLFLAVSLLATSMRSARTDRALRAVALFSIVVVGAGSVVALTRARRMDTDRFVADIPVVRTLAWNDSLVLGDGTAVTYRWIPRSERTGHAAFEPNGSCVLDGIQGATYPALTCERLLVRHDVASDVWVVETDWRGDHHARFRAAFTTGDRRSRDLYVSDIAGSIAPPLAWTLSALVGVVLGALLCFRAFSIERGHVQAPGVEGDLRRDGWATIAGRPPLLLPGSKGTPPGPVVVHLRPDTPVAYREPAGGEVTSWHTGTLADARDAIAARATTLYAIALSSALICAAPLLVSGLGVWR